MAQPMTQAMQVMSKEESQQMMKVWPDIVHDIIDVVKDFNIPEFTEWMQKTYQYNVPEGKKMRGLTLIYAYKMLISNDQLTEDNLRLVRILAWCVELAHVFRMIVKDIMDRSPLRRGKPCWYLCNDIGKAAANDGILFQNTIYCILKKHFDKKECYVDLLETFQEIIFTSARGVCLQSYWTNIIKKPYLDRFTMDRYISIVDCKTSYISFLLPITLAMQFAGIKDPELFKQAKIISLKFGRLLQVQDDYLACFGKASDIDDTDIQKGAYTWLIVVALQRATPEQHKILEECYGISDPTKINLVKQLFTDLNLMDAYIAFKEDTYNLTNTHIQQMSGGLPKNLFSDLLECLYRRTSRKHHL